MSNNPSNNHSLNLRIWVIHYNCVLIHIKCADNWPADPNLLSFCNIYPPRAAVFVSIKSNIRRDGQPTTMNHMDVKNHIKIRSRACFCLLELWTKGSQTTRPSDHQDNRQHATFCRRLYDHISPWCKQKQDILIDVAAAAAAACSPAWSAGNASWQTHYRGVGGGALIGKEGVFFSSGTAVSDCDVSLGRRRAAIFLLPLPARRRGEGGVMFGQCLYVLSGWSARRTGW